MHSQITYQSALSGEQPITIELGGRAVQREGSCDDVCLSRALAVDCPLKLCCLVRTDGSVIEWYADWIAHDAARGNNTYWHLDHGSQTDATGDRFRPAKSLTQAQRETLIRIWGGEVRPFGVRGSCGAPVMAWIDTTPAEIEAILGRMPALA